MGWAGGLAAASRRIRYGSSLSAVATADAGSAERGLPQASASPPNRKPIIELDLDLLQWPAMLVTIAAAWLVGSQSKLKRRIGFWAFLVSNVLWVVWGWSSAAWALVVLQVALAALNIRGARKNDTDAGSGDKSPA